MTHNGNFTKADLYAWSTSEMIDYILLLQKIINDKNGV